MGLRVFFVLFKSGYHVSAFCCILVPQSFYESLPEVSFNLEKLKLSSVGTFGMTLTLGQEGAGISTSLIPGIFLIMT